MYRQRDKFKLDTCSVRERKPPHLERYRKYYVVGQIFLHTYCGHSSPRTPLSPSLLIVCVYQGYVEAIMKVYLGTAGLFNGYMMAFGYDIEIPTILESLDLFFTVEVLYYG